MTVQVNHFVATIPTTATASSPYVLNMQLGIFVVDWVEFDVPDGWNGAVGFYLASSNNQVIPVPTTGGSWLVLNNTSKHYDLQALPTSGDWQLYAYNTGAYPHSLYIAFGLDVTPPPGTSGGIPETIPLATLTS